MPIAAPPRKSPNCQKRAREHLLSQEIEAMLKAARNVGRHRNRDATLILLAYRHGLRVSEVVALRWEQID
ncbi:MAG TPA: tyrosine-type recombinase/integrase, partial [Candidatus Caenarcaniphilales bacterium]